MNKNTISKFGSGCNNTEYHCDKKNKSGHNEISGRQRNHGSFCVPDDLPELNEPRLWLAVARWALMLGKPVNRNDISCAFRISPRRAADVMTYLCEDRRDTVTCEKTITRVASGVRVATILITAIEDTRMQATRCIPERINKPKPSRKDGGSDEQLRAARALFLGLRSA